jgi:hypothetical protein
MSSTDVNDDDKRSAIAKREWINDAGEKVVAGDASAVGFRYTYLATGKSVDYIIGEAGKLSTMFGIMGGLTKVGNIVNSIVNADDYDGTSDPMPEVEAWLKEADAGKWREPGEGVARGPKYDKDVLAQALVATLASAAKGDAAHYRTRLDDRSYYAKVRANVKVMSAYMAEMAKRGTAQAQDSGALA